MAITIIIETNTRLFIALLIGYAILLKNTIQIRPLGFDLFLHALFLRNG